MIIIILNIISCDKLSKKSQYKISNHYFVFYDALLGVNDSDSLRNIYFNNAVSIEKKAKIISLDSINLYILQHKLELASLKVSKFENIINFNYFEVDTLDSKYPYCSIKKNTISSLLNSSKKNNFKILNLEYPLDSSFRRKRKLWCNLDINSSPSLIITWSSQPMLLKRELIDGQWTVTELDYYSWHINEYTDTIWTNIDEKVIREWYPHFKGVYIKEKYEEVYIDYGKYPDPKDVFKTIKIEKAKKLFYKFG